MAISKISIFLQVLYMLSNSSLNYSSSKRGYIAPYPIKSTVKANFFIGSNDSSRYFLSQREIKINGIRSIKIFNNTRENLESNSTHGFVEYNFVNGRLTTELAFDDSKVTLADARDLEYHYFYSKLPDGKSILYKRIGDAYNSHSHEDHIAQYFYKNEHLSESEYTTRALNQKNNSLGAITGRESDYYYYNNINELDSIKNVNNDRKITYQYFIYRNDQIVGYFPAKTPDDMGIEAEDSIYFTKKAELRRIGFQAFKKKYLSGGIYAKIINDCYKNIDVKDLIIDNLNITQYLAKKKIDPVKYLVIEVSDNYFLFLKIN